MTIKLGIRRREGLPRLISLKAGFSFVIHVARKKTWTEKLEDSKGLPRVEKINDRMSKVWGCGTMVIPAPKEVDEIMRKVPAGKVITINEIRAALAKIHNTTICCPITTGIFARIAAGAAVEQQGKVEHITPYWRTLKSGGVINEKYPGGIEGQKRLLQKEGHKIVQKGKNSVVVEYARSLARV